MSPDLLALAERIDTGTASPDTSRALVVFNLTEQPCSGVAVFYADMAWPKDLPLPPVVVQEWGGAIVPSALTDWREGPDAKGRADRRQIAFALHFVVQDVPARGWRTYIASYTDGSRLHSDAAFMEADTELIVVETQRHSGNLPPVGQFAPDLPA